MRRRISTSPDAARRGSRQLARDDRGRRGRCAHVPPAPARQLADRARRARRGGDGIVGLGVAETSAFIAGGAVLLYAGFVQASESGMTVAWTFAAPRLGSCRQLDVGGGCDSYYVWCSRVACFRPAAAVAGATHNADRHQDDRGVHVTESGDELGPRVWGITRSSATTRAAGFPPGTGPRGGVRIFDSPTRAAAGEEFRL